MKNKRLLFSLLLASLFALLCFGAFAAAADKITINNGDGNSGITLDSTKPFLVMKDASAGQLEVVADDPGDGTVVAEFRNGVFTLRGDTVIDNRGGSAPNISGFEANGDLTITDAPTHPGAKLTAIGADNSAGDSFGIFINGALTVTGSSAVSGTGGAADKSYGVYSYAQNDVAAGITVKGNASLSGTGGSTKFDSFGVSVSCSSARITVEGNASLEGTGGAASWDSNGVYVKGFSDAVITVKDNALLTGTGGKINDGHSSRGVFASCLVEARITVEGEALLTGTGGGEKGASYGVLLQCDYGNANIRVKDAATLFGAGSMTSSNGSTFGVYVQSQRKNAVIVVEGGAELYGEGGTADYESKGVHVESSAEGSSINVTSGSKLAGTGKVSVYIKGYRKATISITNALLLCLAQEQAVEFAGTNNTFTVDGAPAIADLADLVNLKRLAISRGNAQLMLKLPDGVVGQDYSASLLPGILSLLTAGEMNFTPPQTGLPEGISAQNTQLEGVPKEAGQYTLYGELDFISGDGDSNLKVLPDGSAANLSITYSLSVINDPLRMAATTDGIGSIRGYDGYITLRVVDENGNAVTGASVEVNSKSYTSGADGTLSVPCMNGSTMAVYVTTLQYGKVRVRLNPVSGSAYDVSITGQPEIALAKG